MPVRSTALLLALLAVPALAADKVPVLLDTDIGSESDDAFALGLIVNCPEIDVRGVTTCGAEAEDRAWIACRFLTSVGRRDVPVAAGGGEQPGPRVGGQIVYRRHPAPIFNRTTKPEKMPASEFLYEKLKAEPGKLTLLAVGPLTNVARMLADHPDAVKLPKRVVVMGGSVALGYDGKPGGVPEWNIATDAKAARAVLAADWPLTVVPLDASVPLKLDADRRKKVFAACTPVTLNVQSLVEMHDNDNLTLFDPAAVAACVDERFFAFEEMRLTVADDGLTTAGPGKANARVAKSVKAESLLDWLVGRLTAGDSALPKEPGNRSKLVERGGFPNRVHAAEDFETDIEKRWWMSGRLETKDTPPGRGRACRGVLTQDFDDRQGDMKTLSRAVIFNPVPGPPMGKSPRLSFRYKLTGTDTLRVQIYSLTNGYHRYLSLAGLPQGRWETGTVDMTACRRPDGTGGPLSQDERIDDIQFYVDPRADLLIDDIVLYDAATDGEKRPFPERVFFTGVFDTGKQGKEWPGDFEIADKAGSFWKAAKSLADGQLRVGLRGDRPAGDGPVRVSFRYKLTGAEGFTVAAAGKPVAVPGPKRDEWASADVELPAGEGPLRDVTFRVPAGGTLMVDDVLLYR